MPGITESNITLNFPDNNFFRFCDNAGYRPLSGNFFKEMDACWYETAHDTYWLFELKDYTLATLQHIDIVQRAWDIVKKAIDSLCMFLCSKHNYPYSANLNPGYPVVPNANTQFRFITVVHCNPSQVADVQLIHNEFRNRFKPYAQLFGIAHYGVVEHSRAIANIPYNLVT